MSVASSKTDIVNLAFDIIKSENINNVEIPGENKQAVVMNRWYDDTRQDALEGFPWNFATKRKAIALNATDPAFGFDDAYVLPNDYLSLNFIEFWYVPLSKYDYMIENGNIYINNDGAGSLDVGYTYDQATVSKWTPSFKIFVAYKLADLTVYKLTGNVSLGARIKEGLKQAELAAKAKNGKANPPVAYRQSKMLNARRVFGGSRTTGLFAGQNGRT